MHSFCKGEIAMLCLLRHVKFEHNIYSGSYALNALWRSLVVS